MLEFNDEKLKIKVNGNEINISYPSFKQVIDYGNEVKKIDEDKIPGYLLDFLNKLGLPKDVAMNLRSSHIEAIINELMPTKKKN